MSGVNIPPQPPPARPDRRAKAAATRRRIAEAAYGLFAAQGYAATTMEMVAREAGVAVQTVYFVFHTKPELLVSALKVAGGGPGESMEVTERPWVREAIAATDGGRRLALTVEGGNSIYRRLAPMLGAVGAATALDTEVALSWTQLVARRRDGMRSLVGLMAARGELRPGLDEALATDVLFGLLRPELYLAFVVECGWSTERYDAWMFTTLCRQLLPMEVAAEALTPGATATTGVSFEPALRLLPLR
jgi:TetR/AcrR family transcriptional regulator of autoinduction and epiphytic fitness